MTSEALEKAACETIAAANTEVDWIRAMQKLGYTYVVSGDDRFNGLNNFGRTVCTLTGQALGMLLMNNEALLEKLNWRTRDTVIAALTKDLEPDQHSWLAAEELARNEFGKQQATDDYFASLRPEDIEELFSVGDPVVRNAVFITAKSMITDHNWTYHQVQE